MGYESDIKFKKINGKKGIKFSSSLKRFLFRRIYKKGKIISTKYSKFVTVNN